MISPVLLKRVPEKSDTTYASPDPDTNFPLQTHGHGVRKPANHGGRDVSGRSGEVSRAV